MKTEALINKRAYIRHDLQIDVQYTFENYKDQFMKGILIDISAGGASFYAFQPLFEGQNILITNHSHGLRKRSLVRWCHELGDNIYKVGVMFQ